MRAGPATLLAVLLVLAGCAHEATEHGTDQLAGRTGTTETTEQAMANESLATMIRAGHDDKAIASAAASGGGARETLAPLLADPDPEVRATALRAAVAAEPDRTAELGVMGLADRDDDVKAAAVRILRPSPPDGHVNDVIAAFDTADDPILKAEIALLAGRLDPPPTPDTLSTRLATARDSDTRLALTMALARNGDEKARDAFIAQMTAADGREAYDLIESCVYFEDTWPVPALSSMLGRSDVVLHLAPDFDDTLPFRVCDVALEMIVRLTGEGVEFETPRPTQYKPGEIDAVRRIASGYSR